MSFNENMLPIFSLLERAAFHQPHREAIFDLKVRMTYEELKENVERVVANFVRLGIKQGDKVGVCLPNWHETVMIFFAAAKLGAIVVPFNPNYQKHETAYILNHSKPKLLFVSEKFLEISDVNELFSQIESVVSVRFTADLFIPFSQFLTDEKVEGQFPVIDVNHDLFCILYTSGTTGAPKGVMITHRSVVQSANMIRKILKLTSDDVFIVPAPLFHIFGITCNLAASFVSQAKIVLQEKFKASETLRLIEQEKVTVHQGVPTMFILELNDPNFHSYRLSSLRTGMVGAAPCSPETIRQIREKMGLNLCVSYGITEAGSVTLTEYDEEESNLFETVGKPISGVELKIVDENRNSLPEGEIGEIACKGFGVMKGYYQSEEETKKVLDDDGWFYTGDLGSLDKNGYLKFVGRKKEMIIRGGYNIYPQEIEVILAKHEKVLDSAVIGLPDKVLGEIVSAVIKLKEGVDCTAAEIQSFLGKYLASYKVPSNIIFVEQFPVTASGKIQKLKLRDELIQQLG